MEKLDFMIGRSETGLFLLCQLSQQVCGIYNAIVELRLSGFPHTLTQFHYPLVFLHDGSQFVYSVQLGADLQVGIKQEHVTLHGYVV